MKVVHKMHATDGYSKDQLYRLFHATVNTLVKAWGGKEEITEVSFGRIDKVPSICFYDINEEIKYQKTFGSNRELIGFVSGVKFMIGSK